MIIAKKTTSTGSPKQNHRNPTELLRSIKGEVHDGIGKDEGDRAGPRVVEPKEELLEWLKEAVHDRVGEAGDVLGGIRVGGGEPIRDGLEPEGGQPVQGVLPSQPQEPAVVVLVVHKGDVEAKGVEELG